MFEDLGQYVGRGEYDHGPEDREAILRDTSIPPTLRELAIQCGMELAATWKITDLDLGTVSDMIGVPVGGLAHIFETHEGLQEAVKHRIALANPK